MSKSSDADLFGFVRRAVKRKTTPAPNGSVQRLIGVYVELFERRFKEKPHVLKADGAQLKALVLKFGEEKVEARLRAYLAWDNDYAQRKGFTLRVFSSLWNELTVALHKTPSRSAVPDAERTAAYLRQLREG